MIIIFFLFVTILFVFYAPYYLKKSSDIKPTKNKFDKFVETDNGYPWSYEKCRLDSYKIALQLKKSINEKG